MILFQIYFNGEYLPTEKDPQKFFYLTSPQLFKWGFSAPIRIGSKHHSDDRNGVKEFTFIVLGFGFVYNVNWDN
jgi:hypothetical protein